MARKETRGIQRRKNGSGQRAKPPTPSRTIDERMGKEEKNIKQKKEQKKETGTGNPIQKPGYSRQIIIISPCGLEVSE